MPNAIATPSAASTRPRGVHQRRRGTAAPTRTPRRSGGVPGAGRTRRPTRGRGNGSGPTTISRPNASTERARTTAPRPSSPNARERRRADASMAPGSAVAVGIGELHRQSEFADDVGRDRSSRGHPSASATVGSGVEFGGRTLDDVVRRAVRRCPRRCISRVAASPISAQRTPSSCASATAGSSSSSAADGEQTLVHQVTQRVVRRLVVDRERRPGTSSTPRRAPAVSSATNAAEATAYSQRRSVGCFGTERRGARPRASPRWSAPYRSRKAAASTGSVPSSSSSTSSPRDERVDDERRPTIHHRTEPERARRDPRGPGGRDRRSSTRRQSPVAHHASTAVVAASSADVASRSHVSGTAIVGRAPDGVRPRCT